MKDIIVWEADVECTSCKGTGLYKGFAEKGGAAVVCDHCGGTGKEHVKYEYTPFIKRQTHTDVSRVYKNYSGYIITDEDVTTDDGKIIKFSKAGVSYEEWLFGKKPLPIKDLLCPLQHFDQGTEIGEWLKDLGPCASKLNLGDSIPKCSEHNRKSCWKWFETCKYKHSI